MRYAIIQTGGKQYKAVEGEAIEVEKLDAEVGKKVELSEVMLVADGDQVMVGTPTVADAKVAATVVAQDKGEKISVFKYKPKIRYRVKTGHRQRLTRLQIDSIEAKGLAKSEPKAEAKEPKAQPTKASTPVAAAKPTAAKPKAKAPKAKAPAAKKKPAKASTPKSAKPKAKTRKS
ncbi:MAG: 50S ribosomal protein L21 [Chloroflexi bacterium]|nr:50S ribosomal protein L21 [Chloroflexota bacterium]